MPSHMGESWSQTLLELLSSDLFVSSAPLWRWVFPLLHHGKGGLQTTEFLWLRVTSNFLLFLSPSQFSNHWSYCFVGCTSNPVHVHFFSFVSSLASYLLWGLGIRILRWTLAVWTLQDCAFKPLRIASTTDFAIPKSTAKSRIVPHFRLLHIDKSRSCADSPSFTIGLTSRFAKPSCEELDPGVWLMWHKHMKNMCQDEWRWAWVNMNGQCSRIFIILWCIVQYLDLDSHAAS